MGVFKTVLLAMMIAITSILTLSCTTNDNENNGSTCNTPSVPLNVSASAQSSSSIRISWNSVNQATSYNIYRSTDTWNFSLWQNNISSNFFVDNELSDFTTYYYRVSAVNHCGTSRQSETVGAMTMTDCILPQAPSGVWAEAQLPSNISISWNPISGAHSYKIYRSTNSVGTFTRVEMVSKTTFTDRGLYPLTTYHYRVSAVNSCGEGEQSNQASATTICPTSTIPTGVSAEALSPSSIKVSWNSVSQANTYNVYRSMNSRYNLAEYTFISNTSSPSYTDSGLSYSTIYFYKIRALNYWGKSEFSSSTYAITHCNPPKIPSDVFAYPQSSSSIRVSWSSFSDANSHNIYRAIGSNGEFSFLGNTYSTYYIDDRLSPLTTYYYRVSTVINHCGEGEQSSIASATTLDCPIPTIPTGISAETLSSSSIKVSWNHADNADSYRIYRSLISWGTFSFVGSTSSAYYTDNGLFRNQPYYYKVRAVNYCGESGQSGIVSTTTLDCPIPTSPGNIQLIPEWSGNLYQINVRWTPVFGATSYRVYEWSWGLTGEWTAGWDYFPVITTPSTEYRLIGWFWGTPDIRIKVRAINQCGEGLANHAELFPGLF